jgi:hypothetical protein
LIYTVAHAVLYVGLIPLVLLFNRVFRGLSHGRDLEALMLLK